MSENMLQRIKYMESCFDRLLTAETSCPGSVRRDPELSGLLDVLLSYYEGGLWQRDYEADEQGLIPHNVKRGVLSEDGVWNLLSMPGISGRNESLKIALLQISACKMRADTLEKAEVYCRLASEKGADIAVFPEMFSCGYDIYDRPPEVWTLDAIDAENDFVHHFSCLARELGMAICITYLEKTEGSPRNSLVVFDRMGRRVLDYAKVHTCDFGAEYHLSPGDGFNTAELDTACGPVRIGAMICYDREFPESARLLMLDGAELILVPNACPMEINRLSQLRGRAYENMVAIATCNYPSSVPDCNGHSSVFDGVAYLPELSGSRDTCILEAGEEEGIYMAELDLDMLRTYRASEVHGNAYRRPEKYGRICSDDIREPFIRSDRRK